ncbi:hypothetical protein [Streptomyces bohaiensis]|uniref:hypothetical protein n=1 Tax=Streptomyces bohaiensis TaxID=1431344 RepID=UPI003B7B7751
MSTCDHCEAELPEDGTSRRLCQRCKDQTTGRLEQLPRLHAELSEYLEPTVRPAGSGGHTRAAEGAMPCREDVLLLAAPGGVVRVLENWRAELGGYRPRVDAEPWGTLSGRVKRAAGALASEMEWIAAEWDEAGALARDIRSLVQRVEAITSPTPRSYRLGHCISLGGNGELCGAILRTTGDSPVVACPWCDTVWPSDTWLTLAAAGRGAA